MAFETKDWREAQVDRLEARIGEVERRLEARIERLELRSFEARNRIIVAIAWIPAIAIWMVAIVEIATKN